MIRFVVKGETPAKKNSRIVLKNGKNIPGKKFQQWHEEAVVQILKQKKLIQNLPIGGEVSVILEFIHGDMRRRDSDNGTSSILDLLVDCGVLTDDKWQIVRSLSVTNSYEKGNPMCVIAIKAFSDKH